MRKIVLMLVVSFALLLPTAAVAKHSKSAVDPSLVCDGLNCMYVATGLAADTPYLLVFHTVNPDGHGVSGSYNGPVSDGAGSITFGQQGEDFLGIRLPGATLTECLANEGDYPNCIAGTSITVTLSLKT
jgi:hypothetical protein